MRKAALVQINVDFQSTYLPYSVGCLEAFARRDPEIASAYEFLPSTYLRDPDVDRVARGIAEADVIGFSAYVWNTAYSLELARRAKGINPRALVVFGGPNAPARSPSFLKDHPWVDATLHGEGEAAFRELLLRRLEGDWRRAPSLRFVDPSDGSIRETPRASRIRDLSTLPSPYLSGVFDPLLAGGQGAGPGGGWNVLWETSRGCPFSCTYCDWGSATQSKVNRFPMERLEAELAWFSRNRVEYLMCCDANFGILERDVAIAERLAAHRKESGYPAVFAATYTKNATERSYRIARTLMDARLIRGYTVSTQSVDPQTLKNIRRENISQASFNELQARFNRDGLPTYTDLIVGLPGETYESFVEGVSEVLRRGQFNKVYFIILSILPNAPMADPAYMKRHGLETVWVPQRNLHETVREREPFVERQELVVATETLSRSDWRRAVAYAWMASLVYFDKLLHLPLTLLMTLGKIDPRALFDAFVLESDDPRYPILSRANRLFREKAMGIQNGEPEYCESAEWLRVWWQPDKLAFMEICRELEAFYAEALALLGEVIDCDAAPEDRERLRAVLRHSCFLNLNLIRAPFRERPREVVVGANVYECYRAILRQQEPELRLGAVSYVIQGHDERWEGVEDWCRKVVWYGNKTSAYLSACGAAGEAASAAADEAFDPRALKPYLYS